MATVRITGPLKLVTEKPIDATQLYVRSTRIRPYEQGAIIDDPTGVDITNGVVTMNLVPGPAVILLLDHLSRTTKKIPLIVSDTKTSQSLSEAMQAGMLADDHTVNELESVAQQILRDLERSEKARDEAETSAKNAASSAGAAKTSETRAKSSQTAAKTSETNSAKSASNAKASEGAASASATQAKKNADNASSSATSAQGSASAASTSAGQASTSAGQAKTSASQAKTSATKAATSESNAKASEDAAASSASAAKVSEDNSKASQTAAKTSETNAASSADKAGNSATTAQNASKSANTSAVSASGYAGQASTSADKASASEGAAASSAAAAKTSEDNAKTSETKVDEALAKAVNLAGGIVDESRLSDDLKGKIDSIDTHTHVVEDIEDLPPIESENTPLSVPLRGQNGEVKVSTPKENLDASNKRYVDEQVSAKADVSHTHESADITDTTKIIGFPLYANKVVKTDEQGDIQISKTPQTSTDPVNKQYVDNAMKPNMVTGWASISAPATSSDYGSTKEATSINVKGSKPSWYQTTSSTSDVFKITEEGVYHVAVSFRDTSSSVYKNSGGIVVSFYRKGYGGITRTDEDDPEAVFPSPVYNVSFTEHVPSAGATLSASLKNYDKSSSKGGYFDITVIKLA